MKQWTEHAPAIGWAAFARSDALTDALWGRLLADEWLHMNFVVGSSVWESRRDGTMVSVDYEGERVVHLATQGGDAGAVVSLLAVDFDLVPAAAHDAEDSEDTTAFTSSESQ